MRAFRTFKKPGAAVLLFNVKMAILIGIVYVAFRYLHVDPIAFVIGISIFPLAIVIVAVRHTLSPPSAPPEKTDG